MPSDDLFGALDAENVERCLLYTDKRSGLRAVLVIDDVTLGPAAGGVRTMTYAGLTDAVHDAARLARAMTYKCALAGLDAGGGKMVVLNDPHLDRPRAFARLGAFVQELGGLFRTAGDLGTTADDLQHMARHCEFVHPDETELAGAVALGVVECMKACAGQHGALGVNNLRIAIQGCGAIGSAVARVLKAAGARLYVADAVPRRAKDLAKQLDVKAVDAKDILTADVDIVAPCAVGGVLTEELVDRLRTWAVCGAANNILASPAAARKLHDRGVLYVPDIIASAGAVIAGIGRTVMGIDDPTPLIVELGHTARELLRDSAATGRPTEVLAIDRAKKRLAGAWRK